MCQRIGWTWRFVQSARVLFFKRTGVGIEDLIARLGALSPKMVAIEATGGFEAVVAAGLAGAGLPVVVVKGPSTETPQARRPSKIDWTSAAKDALLWVPGGGHGRPVKHSGLASRCAGLWVVRASIPAPRTNGAQTMSTLSIKSRNAKSAAPKKGSAQSKTAPRRKVTSPAANAKKPTRSVESKAERVAAATDDAGPCHKESQAIPLLCLGAAFG
jgi:hypothetical protein